MEIHIKTVMIYHLISKDFKLLTIQIVCKLMGNTKSHIFSWQSYQLLKAVWNHRIQLTINQIAAH